MNKKKGSNPITAKKENSQSQLSFARRTLIPATNAASTIMDYNNISSKDLDWVDLVKSLSEQCKSVVEGDLVQAKAMLTVQAHTLDIVFNNFAQKAAHSGNVNTLETYLRLSLKAQAQCRLTWETLVNLKKPPNTYFKQENIAVNQQVNNEMADSKTKNPPNELLERQHYERLDIGKKKAAVSNDQNVETVGAINRPTKRKRKGKGRKKRLQGGDKADS